MTVFDLIKPDMEKQLHCKYDINGAVNDLYIMRICPRNLIKHYQLRKFKKWCDEHKCDVNSCLISFLKSEIDETEDKDGK